MTELTIDEGSGLPTLPKHYFWRVRVNTNRYSTYTLVLQLRYKWWIFNFMEKEASTDKRGLYQAARTLATQFYSQLEQSKYLDEILGDYPPKKWTGA